MEKDAKIMNTPFKQALQESFRGAWEIMQGENGKTTVRDVAKGLKFLAHGEERDCSQAEVLKITMMLSAVHGLDAAEKHEQRAGELLDKQVGKKTGVLGWVSNHIMARLAVKSNNERAYVQMLDNMKQEKMLARLK